MTPTPGRNPSRTHMLRWLTQQGWQCRYGGKHLCCVSPGGQTVTLATSPSDTRSIKNEVARVRRVIRHEAL